MFETIGRFVVALALVFALFTAAVPASIAILVFGLGVDLDKPLFAMSLLGLYLIGYIAFSINRVIWERILLKK